MKNTMRYTFALLLLSAGLCSCQKENLGGSLNGETPICVSPVTRLATKAPVAGTTFPDSRTMVMSASYNPETGSASNYFSGISFSKVGSTWSSDKFWPLSGSLNLFAYSIDGLTAGSAVYETNVSEGVTLGIPDNSTAQTDILWGYAAEQTYNASGNAMAFNHAAASLAFTAKCSVPFDASANKGISIQSIVVKSVKNSGTVKLNNDMTCVWSSLGDSKDLTLPGLSLSYQVPGTASTAAFGVGETGLIVLPQSATSFEVTYTIHNGKDGSGNKIDNSGMKFSFTCEGDWVYGKKYTYALNFNLNSVSVAPSVIDWTDGGSTGVDIPPLVVATYAMKADAGVEASLPKVKMAAASKMGVEWGDDNTNNYSAEAETEVTPSHTYASAYDGIVNIVSNKDSELEFQVTPAEAEEKGLVIVESDVAKTLKEPYALCFSADGEDQLLFTNVMISEASLSSLQLQYSYDNKTWNTWKDTTINIMGAMDIPTYILTIGTAEYPKVYIRGKNPSGISYFNSDDDCNVMQFINYSCLMNMIDPSVISNNLSCTGNIMSLIDYENENLLTIPNKACFACLFMSCTSLTTAPELPATTLANDCYSGMFIACTSLTTAPELPATILADNCYYGMFGACALTTAPELPATTLAKHCYEQMFCECISLTTAPELPATILADNCYYEMFRNCTSLTTAPELPATTLAKHCYEQMFMDCQSLITPPALPATTLTDSCYMSMFSSCYSLVSAPELPATTLTKNCYEGMFSNCVSLTIAPELPATTLADYCYRQMFSNSKLNSAPELPATTLSKGCYSSMFGSCASLVSAPVLSASILTDYCYASMFHNCNLLNSVTMKATDVSANNCLGEGEAGAPYWLWCAGTSAVSPTLYVDPSMVSNSTITANKGNFTVTAIP